MRYTHVVWDFNGTVLDDVDTGIACANALLSRRGLKTLESREAYREVFGFPIIDYYRRLGFDFARESYQMLAKEWVAEYLSRCPAAPLGVGVNSALSALAAAGIPQTLISATETEMLKGQIAALGIGGYFTEIIGLDNIHAASKERLAREWAARVRPARAVFIGDTVHDAEVAAASGAECLLLANGHQDAKRLRATGCAVLGSAAELAKYIME